MPTNTYVALDKKTVTSAVASVEFTGISSAYTDLVIVCAHSNSSTSGVRVQVGNGSIDTGSNYSITYLLGDGSSATSGRAANDGSFDFAYVAANSESNLIINVMNYANTTTYKSFLTRNNGAAQGVTARVGLWRSTSAINQIKFAPSTGNFNVGSTFSLYGIKSQVTGTAKATGGTITYDAFGNVIHTFTSSGTFTPSQSLSVDYLVVAGGGGGGRGAYGEGGGGGAGGLRSTVGLTGGGGALESALSVTAQAYTIQVGGGGTGGTGAGSSGASGTDSIFSTVTSIGGGGGAAAASDANRLGKTGGSGGGGGGTTGVSGTGGSGTANQGYAGGNSPAGSPGAGGGGGGGAAAIGATGGGGNSGAGGAGGAGVSVSISGSSVAYGGGGGGSSEAGSGGAGGTGGGGSGGSGVSGAGANGTDNTGGGGGSGFVSQGIGGSGIVIIRYAG